MDTAEINSWLGTYGSFFPKESLPRIYEMLERLPESGGQTLEALELRSPQKAMSLSLCFGYIGADRWYLGQWLPALVKTLTLGLAGAGMIYDWFAIQDAARRLNLRTFENQLYGLGK